MKKWFFALLVFSSIMITVPFYAEETHSTEAKHEEGAHEETWVQIAGKWVNFATLVAILYYFVTRSLRVQDKFKAESDGIRQSIESARQAKAEAERQMQIMDERMQQMTQEVAKIKEHALHAAEEEKQRILESAQKEAQRIVDMAHREIDSEVRNARKSLRKHVADIAVQQGKEILEEEMNETDQQRLISTYIDQFGK
jgi:F-type H+-transporting ATPase subunit b